MIKKLKQDLAENDFAMFIIVILLSAVNMVYSAFVLRIAYNRLLVPVWNLPRVSMCQILGLKIFSMVLLVNIPTLLNYYERQGKTGFKITKKLCYYLLYLAVMNLVVLIYHHLFY